jgi:arylsulfatase A
MPKVRPMKNDFRTLVLFVLAFATCFGAAELVGQTKVTKPNIVFILADDVGREVLGCYGGQSYKTPNLDRLAASGAKFEHCYSMPVCHPTRITLLTGRYPRHLNNPKWGSFPAASERSTFAHVAKNAGYSTVVAGKWQICMMKDDLDHPKRLGFDEWSVFGWHEGARYHEPMIYENGKLRKDTKGKYGPNLYVDFLVDFIKRKKDEPFVAYYSMALCHDVTDDLKQPVPYGEHDRYDNYTEMANMMDVQVGRLVDALDQMKLRENTLILFTTDNGTSKRSIIRAENGKYIREPVVSKMNGKDIPGGKGDLIDWGTRVPTIASWPGVIEPTQTWKNLVDFSDVLPTIADLTGGTRPPGVPLDGHSFAGLLTGKSGTTRQWAYAEGRGRFFAKTERWKLYNDGAFFDLKNDPNEKKSLPVSDKKRSMPEAVMLRKAIAELKLKGAR